MKASALEFRLRFWIIVVVYTLGFTAPWDIWLHLDGTGPNTHLWARLAMLLYRGRIVGIGAAFQLVLVAGIVLIALGAWLRTWGTACLSADVMSDSNLRGDRVVANGPYRYVRNPLYLGSWAMTLALALLMPLSGAVFTTVSIIVFQLRLILGEEAFLRASLGQPYLDYCARAPRLLPALSPRVPAAGARAHWPQAFLAEIFLWGMTLSFAVLGWQYDANLLLRCVLVWLGVSLIVRAIRTSRSSPAA